MNIFRKYGTLLIHVFALLTIIYLSTSNIKNSTMITILNDEFGYWSNAALIARFPWLSLAQHTPYYCFGYSLILTPLFFLFPDTALMYQAAIVLNCIMLICSYFMAYKMIQRISPETNDVSKIVAAFASIVICSNIFYSHVAWSECYFVFLIWFLLFCLFKLEQKISLRWLGGAALTEILLFTTHQKAIGLFIPFIIAVVLLFKARRKSLLWSVIPLFVVVAAYISQRLVSGFQFHLIEDYRVTNLNDLVVSNDVVSAYWDKILTHLVPLLLSICGKTSVLLFSTLGLALVLVVNWCTETIGLIKSKKSIPKYYSLETFVVVSMLMMLALSSVQMMEDPRKDIVVYSRYFDFVFGPVILLAINKINSKKNVIIMITGLVISLIGLSVISKYSWPNSPDFFNVPCSPLLGGIEHWAGINNVVPIVLWLCTCCIVAIASLKKFPAKFMPNAIGVLCVIVNVIVGYYANAWLNPIRESFGQKTNDLIVILDDYKDKGSFVYLCNNDLDMYCPDMKFLQFVLYDKEILVKDDEDDLSKMNDYILIIKKDDDTEYSILDDDDSELIGATSNFSIYYIR